MSRRATDERINSSASRALWWISILFGVVGTVASTLFVTRSRHLECLAIWLAHGLDSSSASPLLTQGVRKSIACPLPGSDRTQPIRLAGLAL